MFIAFFHTQKDVSFIRERKLLHFSVLESQNMEAAAPPIIIPVTTLSIVPILSFTFFLLLLNIIVYFYDSILLILIDWLSNLIFGICITRRLFSMTALICEKSILSERITFLRNFPQKHSSFFTCISCS